MKITEHFSISEVEKSETAKRLGIDNTLPENLIPNVKRVCEKLERIRALYNKPIISTSFYRCEELNNKVGGSKTSAHVNGLACDFTIKGKFPHETFRTILDAGIMFDQLILEEDKRGGVWIHIGLEKEGEAPRQMVMFGKKDKNSSSFTRVERG